MFSSRFVLVVTLVAPLFTRASCKRHHHVFLEAETSYDPDYMSNYEIKIVPRTPGPTANIKMVFTRNFTIDPMMEIHVRLKQSANQEYRQIFKFDFDFCKIFTREERRVNPMERNVGNVLDIWMTNLKRYGNMPTCPILAGEYVIENFKANKNSIPPFMINGIYRVDVFYYLKNTNPRHYTTNSTIISEIRRK